MGTGSALKLKYSVDSCTAAQTMAYICVSWGTCSYNLLGILDNNKKDMNSHKTKQPSPIMSSGLRPRLRRALDHASTTQTCSNICTKHAQQLYQKRTCCNLTRPI